MQPRTASLPYDGANVNVCCNEDELNFQNFLLLLELKNHSKIRQKQLRMQQYQQIKNKIENRIKILPMKYAKGLREYNGKQQEKVASRRISLQISGQPQKKSQLPFIKRSMHIQNIPNLKVWFRRDQVNSLRSQSFKIESDKSAQLNKSLSKDGLSKLKTEPSEINYDRMGGKTVLKKKKNKSQYIGY